ncbi:hypothetical protein QJU96_09555 [Pasteurella skyensis]|uniref:DUF2752 domain-containing protein n=1 Tax=Phocoenobacter skyensis TaxID=97481 RepID=A0AAJ6P330_9PAST|nr:hypothetical protein [Pasteurella skyensis]MDP8171525.1 hypothetical protein [Pasteurella skyensis]MDP8175427.1 hypothetical protein [Pasteurella skyensis]
MKTKCPACGSINSLDSLIGNEQASQAIYAALTINGELGQALIGYLGLFRPEKSALTFERVATILNQLLPDVQAQEIKRDGVVYPAPVSVWVSALREMLKQRHCLKLPMKSHGYLYEIIAQHSQQAHLQTSQNSAVAVVGNQSKTVKSIKGIKNWLENE